MSADGPTMPTIVILLEPSSSAPHGSHSMPPGHLCQAPCPRHTARMRIFIDARMMGAAKTRGIGRVIYALLQRLLADRSLEWTVLVRDRSQLDGLPRPARSIVADIPWYGLQEQLRLPSLIRSDAPDLVFFPHWNVPVFVGKPFVCFIHDLLLFRHPESSHAHRRHRMLAWGMRIGQRLVLRSVVRRAKTLLVPTQFVADELTYFFPKAKGKTVVVGEGIEAPLSDDGRVPFEGPYFLTVGSAYPHKRLDLVLRAWKTLGSVFPRHALVLVGEMEGFRRDLCASVEREGVPRVFFPGAVSDASLASWYRHADLLLFPSAAEGFGLPPLEAMSYGCPVLASDLPVLREVLPSMGVRFFRNGDVDDMMAKWNEAVHDRARLRAELPTGFAYAASRHTWDAAARRVRALLRLA